MYTNKILAFLFIGAFSAAVSARKPQVTLGLNTANRASSFGGLEPHATWSTGTRLGEVNVDGGIDIKVEDVDYYPYNIWGKAQRAVAGWNLSAQVQACSKNLQSLALNLLAVSDDGGTTLYAEGRADTLFKVAAIDKLTVVQKLFDDAVTLVPTYNFTSNGAELGLTYSGLPDTIVNLDASMRGPQMLTVSQKIGENNQIIPSVTSAGDFEVEYRRLVDGGIVAANFKPSKSVTLKWNDGPWIATVVAPMIGPSSFAKDISVSFKRDVQLF